MKASENLELEQPGNRRVGRRLFLGMLGAGAAILGGGQALSSLGRLPILRSFIPEDGFYFYTVSDREPVFDGTHWDLRIEGLVESPVTITFARLTGLPQTELLRDYMCVTGWSVKNLTWTGPTVASLIDLARPMPGATAVSFDSADGVYVDSLTLDEARRSDVLLAHRLNGEPLKQDRGGALRLVVPFMFGYKGVKWVNRLRLTAKQEIGYWEQRGYDVDAYLK